jgi:hypothetical protein
LTKATFLSIQKVIMEQNISQSSLQEPKLSHLTARYYYCMKNFFVFYYFAIILLHIKLLMCLKGTNWIEKINLKKEAWSSTS